MKIMLIMPPNPYTPLAFGFPIGLGYLGSVLENEGHEVRLLDALYDKLSIDDVVRKVKSFSPEYVGISVYTALARPAVELAKRIKSLGIKTVAGGSHATYDSETLKSQFDSVIIGEGERNFVDLIYGRKQDNLLIDDLDTIPFPAYHLVDFQKYIKADLLPNAVSIMSSRGCSHRCAFCAQSHFQRRWRSRSPPNVIKEMKFLLNKYQKIQSFQFYDDNFTLDQERVYQMCDMIIKNRLNKFQWCCLARVDQVTEPLLKRMKEAGCRKISYGVESSSPVVLKNIRKGLSLEKVKAAFSLTSSQGMESLAFFMIGNPGDTQDTINKSIRFAKSLRSTSSLWSIAQVYPGTELAKLSGITDFLGYVYQPEITNPSPFTHPFVPVFTQPGLDRETLKKLQKKILKQFLFHHSIRNFATYFRHFVQSPKDAYNYMRMLLWNKSTRVPNASTSKQ